MQGAGQQVGVLEDGPSSATFTAEYGIHIPSLLQGALQDRTFCR